MRNRLAIDYSELDERLLRLAAAPYGVAAGDVACDKWGLGPVGGRIVKLRAEGKLFTGKRGHKTHRHFTNEADAKKWESTRRDPRAAQEASFKVRRVAIKLDPNAPLVIPPNVKITQCPNYMGDKRFAPGPDFERVITADWRARRLQELKAERR